MAIITLDDYREFASINGNNAMPQVEALILSCSNIVEDYLGYSVDSSVSSTKKLLARKGQTEYLLPVTDPIIISINYTSRITGAEIPVAEKDYMVEDTGMLTFLSLAAQDNDIITVEYSLASKATESIKLATMLLVQYYFKLEYNKTSQSMGGETVTYQTGKNFPPHVRAILSMYRIF